VFGKHSQLSLSIFFFTYPKKYTLSPTFHCFFNLVLKVKKFAMHSNQVFKICNVAIPLDDFMFPNGKCRTCDFWSRLHQNGLSFSPVFEDDDHWEATVYDACVDRHKPGSEVCHRHCTGAFISSEGRHKDTSGNDVESSDCDRIEIVRGRDAVSTADGD
jgi:hypothetical protein